MTSHQELPIRLVIATKLKPELFLTQSATGRSVNNFINTSKAQVQLYASNSIGLGELYNDAIEKTAASPAILVFMHDDVLITDYFWANNIRAGLEKFDIVGIAGNTRRLPNQPGWIMADINGTLDDSSYLSGSIGQGFGFPPDRLDVFGPSGRECKLLDGVLLAASSKTLQKSGLRFDAQFKFHFYDLDFCRGAEVLNLKMGTIPLSVVHESLGSLDQEWHMGYKNYLEKWES